MRYYKIGQYLYRVFNDIIQPQMLIEGIGWMDSIIFRSEQELVITGAQPTQPPY